MSRIASCFKDLANTPRKALISYVVAGDPSIDDSVSLLHAMVEEGVDLIELGVPFSDPMAEGPTIQRAHERALAEGVTLAATFDLVRAFRETNQTTPIVLMGYANPVEVMGYPSFAKQASAAGVDGVLIVDLPPEESQQARDVFTQYDLDMILLIAPTTSDTRMKSILKVASGYVYYVSLKGVTGVGQASVDEVHARVQRIQSCTDLPVAVGFGINNVNMAEKMANISDGVIVGSAIVDLVSRQQNKDDMLNKTRAFVRQLRHVV